MITWWIAGGWALDLFIGRTTRWHADLDLQIFRSDQLWLQAHLTGWQCFVEDPPGQLRRWRKGELLMGSLYNIWCRKDQHSAWTP